MVAGSKGGHSSTSVYSTMETGGKTFVEVLLSTVKGGPGNPSASELRSLAKKLKSLAKPLVLKGSSKILKKLTLKMLVNMLTRQCDSEAMSRKGKPVGENKSGRDKAHFGE